MMPVGPVERDGWLLVAGVGLVVVALILAHACLALWVCRPKGGRTTDRDVGDQTADDVAIKEWWAGR